jgi:hypothetical protein
VYHDRSDGSLVGGGGCTCIDLDGETVLDLGRAVGDARTGPRLRDGLRPGDARQAGEHKPELPVVAFNRASRAVMERLALRLAGII